MSFSQKRIFVTGGSGFVGGRLIESLVLDHGAEVRALVHRPNGGALRMTRLPVEWVAADLTDLAAMVDATKGCDVIFHLAYGNSGTEAQQRRITVDGTRTIVEAALQNRIGRFVNVSTAAVYFAAGDGVIDETAPRKAWGWDYSDAKLDAENIVMESCRTQGLAGTNVQVAGVYGPWGETFTIAPLRQLQTGRVALVNGGEGVSNATYVDDVVQALLLAGCKDAAVGETFIVKGSGRITRRELYEAYQRMLGTDSLVSMTIEEIEQARKREKREALINVVPSALSVLKGDKAFRSSFRASHFGNLYQFLRNHTPALAESLRKRSGSDANTAREAASDEVRPLILPPPFFTKYLSAKIEFSAAKAERLLGFAPRYSFAEGMALTEQWARWARLIPEPAVSHITVAV